MKSNAILLITYQHKTYPA